MFDLVTKTDGGNLISDILWIKSNTFVWRTISVIKDFKIVFGIFCEKHGRKHACACFKISEGYLFI